MSSSQEAFFYLASEKYKRKALKALAAQISRGTTLLLQFGLLLSSLEGVLAAVALLSIPGDEKNEWILGLSAARWVMFACAFTAIYLSACGFWLLTRHHGLSRRFLARLTTLLREPVQWAAVVTTLLAGFVVSLSFCLNSLSVAYSASNIRLVPLAFWFMLGCAQFLVILSAIYITAHRAAFKLLLPVKKSLLTGLAIFFISFSVRAIFTIPVVLQDTPPKFDEFGYYEEIVGFEQIAREIRNGRYPSETLIDLTYNDGKWPPLHPLLLASVNYFFDGGLSLARWSVVVFSALTSVVVFAIGSTLAGRKIGLASAGFHIVYPTLIAYAHYLWSETTYIFFLLLSLYTLIRLVRARDLPTRMFFSLLTGLFLGLSGLVRTTSLPFLIIIPLWIFLLRPSVPQRALPSLIIPVVCLLTWLPWLSFLQVKEGRFIPLATTGGYNLYLGNNPYGTYEDRPFLVQNMDNYAKLHFIDRDLAARMLAEAEIRNDPLGFMNRSISRVLQLWGSDTFVMRHIYNLAYPPLEPRATLWIWAASTLGYIMFWLFTVQGYLRKEIDPGIKWLTALIVVSGMALPAISIAPTRLHLPLIAVMLPFTGAGIAHFKDPWSRGKKISTLLAGFAVILLIAYSFKESVAGFRPSAYFSESLSTITQALNIDLVYRDRLALRGMNPQSGAIQLRILTEGYTFKENDEPIIIWRPADAGAEVVFVLVSEKGKYPVQVEMVDLDGGERIVLEPFEPAAWMAWIPSGLNEVEYSWTGGD